MRQQQAEQTPISEVMHPHPHCVTEQQWVRDLVSLFLDEGISAVPVVDGNGKPIGLVSKTDVVRAIKGGHAANSPEVDTHIQPWWDADRLSQLKVGEIMTPTL
jgi:CBS-domain-containing membrane protein